MIVISFSFFIYIFLTLTRSLMRCFWPSVTLKILQSSSWFSIHFSMLPSWHTFGIFPNNTSIFFKWKSSRGMKYFPNWIYGRWGLKVSRVLKRVCSDLKPYGYFNWLWGEINHMVCCFELDKQAHILKPVWHLQPEPCTALCSVLCISHYWRRAEKCD